MKTELYKSIKAINLKNLNENDKEELLRIFMVTKNPLIRNHIALIFADLHYEKAISYIFKKINEKITYNNNGTLVYSLEGFELRRYFVSIIKIICEQEYEARLLAFGLAQKVVSLVSKRTKAKALKTLIEYQSKIERSKNDKGENSTLHFIKKTKELLQQSSLTVESD